MGAHLGLHLPGSSSSAREPPAGQTPPSPPSTQRPSAARPTAPAAGLPPHAIPTQARANPQTQPIPAAALPADRELIRRQQDEITRLREQVARLAGNQPPAAQPPRPITQATPAGNNDAPAGPDATAQQQEPQRALFMDNAAAEHARAQLVAKAAEENAPKKTSLPDIIPGFKASPLSLGKRTLPSPTWPALPPCIARITPCKGSHLHRNNGLKAHFVPIRLEACIRSRAGGPHLYREG